MRDMQSPRGQKSQHNYPVWGAPWNGERVAIKMARHQDFFDDRSNGVAMAEGIVMALLGMIEPVYHTIKR